MLRGLADEVSGVELISFGIFRGGLVFLPKVSTAQPAALAGSLVACC